MIGGILVPVAAAFDPRVRGNRLSLFLPPAALMPTALAAITIKLTNLLYQKDLVGKLMLRPSETVEIYLYFFILAYLIVFNRRILEIERQKGG